MDLQKSQSLLCQAESSQLLIIDVQTKLGGAMPGKVFDRVVKNATLLLKTAQRMGMPILVSEQYPKGLGPSDPGLAENLSESTPRFEKTCFSCANAEGFVDTLKGAQRPQAILVGMEAHVCVLQTAFGLAQQGFQVFVVEDAICSRRLENYQNALARMQQGGIVLTNAESVVFEWLKDARNEHFKAIAELLS